MFTIVGKIKRKLAKTVFLCAPGTFTLHLYYLHTTYMFNFGLIKTPLMCPNNNKLQIFTLILYPLELKICFEALAKYRFTDGHIDVNDKFHAPHFGPEYPPTHENNEVMNRYDKNMRLNIWYLHVLVALPSFWCWPTLY